MTKRSIDSNWKKLLKTGEVTHKKKKKPKADYIKKTKDGKKTIWFDVDQVKRDGIRGPWTGQVGEIFNFKINVSVGA